MRHSTPTIKKKELIELIEAAIGRNAGYAEACEGNDNPQVVEMATRAQGKVDAYYNVLRALTYNERYMLRVDGAGHIAVQGD